MRVNHPDASVPQYRVSRDLWIAIKQRSKSKLGLEKRSFIEAGGTIHFGNVLYLQNMVPQKGHYNTRFMHTVLQKVEL